MRGKVWLFGGIGALLLMLPWGAMAANTNLIDPVVIRGDNLGPLMGKAPDSIRVFAWDGAWRPVTMQIDERFEVSAYRREIIRRETILTYAFDEVPKGKPRRDPDPSFDFNDELVFMAREAGAKAAEGMGPAGSETCQEIELSVTGETAPRYAYACVMKGPAAAGATSYMNVENADRIEGQTYVMGFPAGNAMSFNSLQFKGPGGLSENVVDRLKVSFDVRVLFNLANYTLTGKDYQHYLRGVRRGPVRVVKEFESVLETFAGLQVRTYNWVYFYPYHVEFAVKEAAPLNWYTLNKSDMIMALDLNHEARGFRFYSDRNPRGEIVDGFMSPSEINMNYGPAQWAGVSGKPGTIIMTMGLGPVTKLNRDLYYVDHDDRSDPLESEPGMTGKFGFMLRDIQKAGWQQWPVRLGILATPEAYMPGIANGLVSMYNTPIKVALNQHNVYATAPVAPAITDTRAEPPKSTFAEPKLSILQTKYLMPNFMLDFYLLGVGGGLSYTDADFLKTGSSFGAGFTFTDRGYQNFNISMANLRWIKGVDSFAFNASYSSFPIMPYYGIGNENDLEHVAYYWWKSTDVNVNFTKYFGGVYGANVTVGYRDVSTEDPIQPSSGGTVTILKEHYGFPGNQKAGTMAGRLGELASGDSVWGPPVYGREGGNLSGFGFSVFRDMRENPTFPKFGDYESIGVSAVSSAWGADYNYARVSTDLRVYLHPDFINPIPFIDGKISPHRTLLTKFFGEDKDRSLALRVQANHLIAEEVDWYGQGDYSGIHPRVEGFPQDYNGKVLKVPFFELTTIGSSSTIRAYTSNRYRNNDMIVMSAEYRWNWWEFQYISVFFDYGQVMYDITNINTWNDTWHPSYGVDWRIVILPNLDIGAELAFSEERMYYITTVGGSF